METENEFEKRILSEVIPPQEIAIRFEDIGALGKVKETLKELVMLPLQRPELFRYKIRGRGKGGDGRGGRRVVVYSFVGKET